jgi:hypothetical protein
MAPRMAKFQGAIFLHTWNDGKLNGLVVEDNTVYWDPPRTAPAVINDAAFQGANGTFRNNRIYSTSPWMITSDRALNFQANQYGLYSHDAALSGEWNYGDRMFQGFAEYQAQSGQDADGSFRQVVTTTTNTSLVFWPESKAATQQSDTTYRDLISEPLVGIERSATVHQLAGKWTLYALLSGRLGTDGLLEEITRRQLIVLRSLAAQFRGNGLETVIALRREPENTTGKGSMRNSLSDLDFDTAAFVAPPVTDRNISKPPLLQFLSPEGQVIKAWRGGFVGAAELGLAVRQKLGNPAYSEIGEAKR